MGRENGWQEQIQKGGTIKDSLQRGAMLRNKGFLLSCMQEAYDIADDDEPRAAAR
jgi:hypothetical protein